MPLVSHWDQTDEVTMAFSKMTSAEQSAVIREMIRGSGYFHLRVPIALDAFNLLASGLGAVQGRTDITIDTVRDLAQQRRRGSTIRPNRGSVYRAEGIGFHTDAPSVSLIGWYCLEPDTVDGANLLLDTRDLTDHFALDELAILSTIQVNCPVLESDTQNFRQEPLISKSDSAYHVYYAPWLLLDGYQEQQSRLLEKFDRYLRDRERTQLIRVRLEKQESLFIDNRRMLHGRGPIAADSKRHLIRVYLRTGRLSKGFD